MSPNLVFNFAKSVIYSAVITFSFSGCGVFYSLNEEPEWSRMERKLNRDPFHVNSCGPTALNDAFSHLGIKVTNLEISEQIQKDGSILRDVMSAFTKEARRITFPSEIKSLTEIDKSKIRVGGMVKKNSISINSNEVNFIITDFKNEINVTYSGAVPNLFAEEKGVVAEGFLKDRNFFSATKILAKHDENYMPPEVKEALGEK